MKYTHFFQKIGFWLAFYFVLRLVGITNPPLEENHNWRQSITCAITQNMYEISPNVLYPRTQFGGSTTGITPTEFPFFNFVAYIFCRLFGYAHWYGRLVGLVASTAGTWAFYWLLRDYSDKKTAFFASLALLSGIWFGFSRVIMPDVFSVSMVLVGIYAAHIYIKINKFIYFIIFVICATLGVLCKITSIVLLVFVLFMVFDKGVNIIKKTIFITSGVGMAGVWYAWYGIWTAHLLHTYHNPMYFAVPIIDGIKYMAAHWQLCTKKFYFDAFLGYIGAILGVVGIVNLIINKKYKVLTISGLSTVFYLILVAKVGYIFTTHNYYIIPVVPMLCGLVGAGVAAIPRSKLQIFVVFALCIEGVANQYTHFFIKPKYLYKNDLEQVMNKISQPTQRVAVADGNNPQLLLFMHRKGWAINEKDAQNPDYLQKLKAQGCAFLVIPKNNINQKLQLNLYFENKYICVYGL